MAKPIKGVEGGNPDTGFEEEEETASVSEHHPPEKDVDEDRSDAASEDACQHTD